MTTFSVLIATFGPDPDGFWAVQGHQAEASGWAAAVAVPQADVTWWQGRTLAEARNAAAAAATGEWLVFLDADDRLHNGYLKAMAEAIETHHGGPHRPLLIQPATRGWVARAHVDVLGRPAGLTMDLDAEANLIPPRAASGSLVHGNHLVIGTAVRRDQFLRVGGFRELPFWEDWDLWVRCWCDGAEIVTCQAAEYLVQVREGRNEIAGNSAQVRDLMARLGPEFRQLARASGRA